MDVRRLGNAVILVLVVGAIFQLIRVYQTILASDKVSCLPQRLKSNRSISVSFFFKALHMFDVRILSDCNAALISMLFIFQLLLLALHFVRMLTALVLLAFLWNTF